MSLTGIIMLKLIIIQAPSSLPEISSLEITILTALAQIIIPFWIVQTETLLIIMALFKEVIFSMDNQAVPSPIMQIIQIIVIGELQTASLPTIMSPMEAIITIIQALPAISLATLLEGLTPIRYRGITVQMDPMAIKIQVISWIIAINLILSIKVLIIPQAIPQVILLIIQSLPIIVLISIIYSEISSKMAIKLNHKQVLTTYSTKIILILTKTPTIFPLITNNQTINPIRACSLIAINSILIKDNLLTQSTCSIPILLISLMPMQYSSMVSWNRSNKEQFKKYLLFKSKEGKVTQAITNSMSSPIIQESFNSINSLSSPCYLPKAGMSNKPSR